MRVRVLFLTMDGRKMKGGNMKGSGDFGWPGQVTHRRTRIKAQLEPKKLVHPPFVLNLYCYVLVSFSLKSC
jgi:hypothetical protein